MAAQLPPIPNDPIAESHLWREWFFNLGYYIQVAQTGGSPWTVPQGGTGVGSITGYLKGNGVANIAGIAVIPYSDISNAPVPGVEAIVNKTGNYTLAPDNYTVRANATSGSLTVTLPLVPVHGQIFNVKKIDSTVNSVILAGNGKLIDGDTTMILGRQYDNIMVQYDSTSTTWNIL